MTINLPLRLFAAAGAVAVGLAIALWLGSRPEAAIAALLAGGGAAALALWPDRSAMPVDDAAPPADEPLPTLPDDLMSAFAEPLLIVRDRRVVAASAAARALLGDHIEGVDVRLAIRHPAAAERLSTDAEDAPDEVDISGLGEVERPWLMQVRPLADGSRLVRLIDQGAVRSAERVRVDFVANASHELRTPLATLIGFLETLEDESAAADAETRTRFVRIMQSEARRMRDLVDDLMSLSRIEAERFSAPRDPVTLPPLIEEARNAVGQLIEARGVELRIENDTDDPSVAGDRAQLVQMLTNLVTNAIKYGRDGGVVRVRVRREGPMLSVAVIDEGEGIPAEHIPRLTERFYRVDPGRSRQVGGTGLGLAIVKHIVQRHRGRLEIRSEPGAGTEARVLLPIAAVTEESRN